MKKFKNLILFLSPVFVFTGCFSPNYKTENGKVFLQEKEIYNGKIITRRATLKDADAGSFKVLEDGRFAKDNRFVYFKSSVLKNADPSSFVVKSGSFSRDKNFAFYNNIQIPDADGKTFEVVDKTAFAKDKNHVYYADKLITGADAKTFEVVDEKTNIAKDKSNFYHNDNRIPIKDYATFEQIQDYFWKDKYNVYYIFNSLADKIIMKGVDPKTVKAISNVSVKDKNGEHSLRTCEME